MSRQGSHFIDLANDLARVDCPVANLGSHLEKERAVGRWSTTTQPPPTVVRRSQETVSSQRFYSGIRAQVHRHRLVHCRA